MQRAVGRCEAAVRNREGHFGAVSQERVDALASINEGGTAEDFKSFRPLLNSEETGAFLVFIRKTMSHAEAVMCLHIGQHLFGECIDMSNEACVRSYEWGGCGSFAEAEQPVLRLLSSFGV